ncbi:hypothetical protein PQR71_13015 [Paraburkholderia fungorum]|uniref:DUF4376 domain-containing protein n=1 Tax=Paraburkholderia fungorum TaxID=134537 RepID=UPI0038BAFC2C
MQFLTYSGNGPFTGAYIQDEAPQGVSYIEVGDADYLNWVNLSYQDGQIVPTPGPSAAQLLASAKASQTAIVSQACQDAIVAGFTSSALGAAHTYPAKPTDQQNLNASVVASILPGVGADWTTPFWCADSAGTWAYVMHTAAQIQQVGTDGKAAILAYLTKNQQLAAQIDAISASTPNAIDAVRAITWSQP